MSRLPTLVALAAAVLTAAAVPAAQAHDPSLRLRAYGTAAVDGFMAPAEWEGAAKWDFAANIPPGEGGGTAPATLFAMNDGANLYLGLRVMRPTVGSTSVSFTFDNDHDGVLYEDGDDTLLVNASDFYDEFVTRQPPCPSGAVCLGIPDADAGGTTDGAGLVKNNGTFSFYELVHPLDTADDGRDFSLRVGKRVGFSMSLRFCEPSCVDTDSPRSGDIVVTSTSTVPPETAIVEGPADGALTSESPVTFRFSATDDAIAPEDVLFECRLDGGASESCANPVELTVPDGRHTLEVRAVDEVGNWDQSPASRRWTTDTTSPAAPLVRGSRKVRKPVAVFRLSARDGIDAPSALRFRCAVDGRPFRSCRSRLRLAVRPGRHVLRVLAFDRAGNRSPATSVRFRRLKR